LQENPPATDFRTWRFSGSRPFLKCMRVNFQKRRGFGKVKSGHFRSSDV
jgi:hypothetical protein